MQWVDFHLLIFGALFIAIVLLLPGGLSCRPRPAGAGSWPVARGPDSAAAARPGIGRRGAGVGVRAAGDRLATLRPAPTRTSSGALQERDARAAGFWIGPSISLAPSFSRRAMSVSRCSESKPVLEPVMGVGVAVTPDARWCARPRC